MNQESSHTNRWLRIGLILAITLGIALRVVAFRKIPPGLYRDEAYTGMDGLRTLEGDIQVFYDSSFGREPLFTWLVALSIGIWGPSPLATRFPSLILGILTLFTGYAMARELFDRRIGVLATAVLAITLWPIHFSRISFRATLIPPLASFGVWQLARGIRTRQWGSWVLAGVAAGLLLYTYIAARAAAIALLCFAVYFVWRQRSLKLPHFKSWLLFFATAALTMAPFIIYTLFHWEQVLLRTKNVASVFNHATPVKVLFNNIFGAIGMFIVRGDPQVRHNMPGRPVFDLAMGVMFIIGLWRSIRAFRRNHRHQHAFLLIWSFSMVLPSLLTLDNPHFIRAIGLLPFITLYPALGIAWTWDKLARNKLARNRLARSLSHRWVGGILLLGLFSFSLSHTIWTYYIRYPALPETCYRFECEGIQVASEVNAYLDRGWTEGDWVVRPKPGRHDRQVFIQSQLWKDIVNAHYLIPQSPEFNVPHFYEITPGFPNPSMPMLFYGWYHKDYPEYWVLDMLAWLPPNALLEVSEGPLAITHQDWTPHPAYVRFKATPRELPNVVLAELDHGIALVEHCEAVEEDRVDVQLVWHTQQPLAENYTAFVHYERDGAVIAQHDASPGAPYHPMTRWRPGDQLMETSVLSVSEILPEDEIWAGMYLWYTGERLDVLTASTHVQDHKILLDIQACDQ